MTSCACMYVVLHPNIVVLYLISSYVNLVCPSMCGNPYMVCVYEGNQPSEGQLLPAASNPNDVHMKPITFYSRRAKFERGDMGPKVVILLMRFSAHADCVKWISRYVT